MLHERQIKKQMFWTNGCFRAAVLEHYSSRLSKKQKRLNCEELKKLIAFEWEEKIAPEVHNLYMKNVLAMNSKRLSLIVEAFQTGQQYRKQETVDAIMTELFERSTNSETRNKHES